ncbi:MAG: nucleotidyltransferase domain-containing protein [Desulfonauticus sp.]|nr:nucleotidyltransferase domain-containing protein [Desulfonauticus sp.]
MKNIVDFLKTFKPDKIVLFGSRAKGYCRKNSDIDMAVDIKLTFREKRKISERIEDLAGIYSVDLIFLPDIDDNFKTQILREGKILYEKSDVLIKIKNFEDA